MATFKKNKKPSCNFCGKSYKEAKKLIQGSALPVPAVHICEICCLEAYVLSLDIKVIK